MPSQGNSVQRRIRWVAYLETPSGSFEESTSDIVNQLRSEVRSEGVDALIDQLRFCGAVPEQYGHDSTQEKLYSKYTDSVVSEAFSVIGLNSIVVDERADSADVQARGEYFSLVADAKAFRLSRTAKNQKDFKIQALDGWRRELDYAVLVCPIYQLPTRNSQIYQQAVARNVCIVSYSHLSTLVALTLRQGKKQAEQGFHDMLQTISTLNPSKKAIDYWTEINKSLVNSLDKDTDLWTIEKTASIESLETIKEESLRYLQSERNRLLGLSHQEALEALVRAARVDSRAAHIRNVEHGNLLGA